MFETRPEHSWVGRGACIECVCVLRTVCCVEWSVVCSRKKAACGRLKRCSAVSIRMRGRARGCKRASHCLSVSRSVSCLCLSPGPSSTNKGFSVHSPHRPRPRPRPSPPYLHHHLPPLPRPPSRHALHIDTLVVQASKTCGLSTSSPSSPGEPLARLDTWPPSRLLCTLLVPRSNRQHLRQLRHSLPALFASDDP